MTISGRLKAFLALLKQRGAHPAGDMDGVAALQQSEARFQAIFDHAGIGITLRSAHDRREPWLAVNDRFCEMTGYSREELLALSTVQLTLPEENAGADRNNARMTRGEIRSYSREKRILRKDGTPIWVEVVVAALPDAGGRPHRVIATYQDINARRLAEERLRESESRFKAMFEHAGIGISLRPAHDRALPWIAVNDKFCEMTGYSRDELLRMSTAEITPADGQGEAIRDNRRLLAGEITSYAREKQLLCRDGSRLWVTLSVAALPGPDGRPAQIMSTYQDINARKLAEERMRQSEQRFRAMFDHAGVGITLRPAHDRNLHWLEVNDRFCEMTGYSREEALRMSTADITAPERTAGALRDKSRLMSGEVGSYGVEKRILRKDGSWMWIALSVTALPDAGGRPHLIIATYQDIDARKQTEERLRAIIAAEPECVAIVAPDGMLVDMNPAGLRMLEADSLEMIRRESFFRQVLPKHRRAFVRLQRQVLAGQSGVLEFEAVGMAGKRRWLEIHAAPLRDASGAITALLGIARDVTERRTAREAIAAERNLLRTVIDNLPDRIRVRDRDLRIILGNEAWRRVRAPGHRDVFGLRNEDLLPPGIPGRHNDEDLEVMATGRPSRPREFADGPLDNPNYFITTKLPLRDGEGRVSGVVVISRDVTDFRRRSLEVEKLNAALEARVAERTAQLKAANEELEAFASSVSHDLRAPLRHIDGLAAAVIEDHAERLDTAGKAYLARIRAAAVRMSGLIEDLLRLSRVSRSELKIADVDLSGMARAIADELHREHPERKVTFRIAPLLRAEADPGLLRSALVNLIHNAWKFTGNKPKATIEFGATQRNGVTAYFVRDNGAGFDMAHAGRLFDAFQRLHTEQEFPGTGIGLATVRRVMRRHGGDAWAESEVGKGATFYFSLRGRAAGGDPAHDRSPPADDASVPATVSMVRHGDDAGRRTVLLVDDDPDVLVLSARALAPDGYRVLTAGRGEDALALLRGTGVDVVVSDFSMPGMDGAQLLAQVTALHPHTLRIIVSGQTMNRAMQAGLRRGEIHHYFEKQHSYAAVRACIRGWLDAAAVRKSI